MSTDALTPTELANAASRCNLTAAVFAKEGTASLMDLAVVFLDEDDGSIAAAVAANGYSFCGTLAVIAGESHAEPEPGPTARAAVMCSGSLFAEKLGQRLKRLQLEQLEQRATPAVSVVG